MGRISAVIVAQDEERHISEAVRSVLPWVDEVLVLDGGSGDHTVERAVAAGARVEQHPFDGYVTQKRRAVALASSDLVFCLDADERVDDELGRAIEAASRAPGSIRGWWTARRNYLNGRQIVGCGWYPDQRVRMFDRRHGGWEGHEPHDLVRVRGETVWLPGHIHHDVGRTTSQHVRATVRHARSRARSLSVERRLILPGEPLLRAAAHLMRKALLGRAWRDGPEGWAICWVGALGVRRKYSLARGILRRS